ncbi:MAG: dCMP deaminase family protein [Eubacteriales bacterium]|jgi:dCMP deaminase|nr:dCMP deaminase family protein [Clostridiales bacterium]MDD7396116.1 dCMP deaminase family protein [Eubacteriales bacterium]MDY2983470.1 dCMP deaminase family protein [Eubacteriales bacterium]
MERVSKKDYYLDIAAAVAKRSTCLRRQYGAVIVKNDEIVATGYNGAPRGEDNCCDVGVCWREAHGIPHGEQYEKCVAVHAECNAIISASRNEMLGSTLYLFGFENGKKLATPQPCLICSRLIKNAGIEKVVTAGEELPFNFAPEEKK